MDLSKTVFVHETRMWQSLAGHGPDPKRIPPLSFALLSIIATHGADGIMQPELVKQSAQDKRSVPKRTDELAKAGYIEKRAVQTKGSKTSLCTLKKLVTVAAGDQDEALQFLFKNRMVQTGKFLVAVMPVIKEAATITVNDLRRKLGIFEKRYESRVLHKYLARMEHLGLLRRISAEVQTDERIDIKAVLKSLQFVRDPTPEDEELFSRFTHGIDSQVRNKKAQAKDEARLGSDDEGEDESLEKQNEERDQVAAMIAELTNRRKERGEMVEHSPLQQVSWRPDRSLYNMVFDVVDQAGPQGISTNGIASAVGGSSYRRPIEMVLGHLTDVWHQTQPEFVRHLALVRDVIHTGRTTNYLYRTHGHFDRAVRQGQAAWETVMPTGKRLKKLSTPSGWIRAQPTDAWGFSTIPSNMLLRGDGSAGPAECIAAVSGIQRQQTGTPAATPRRRPGPKAIRNEPRSTPPLSPVTTSAARRAARQKQASQRNLQAGSHNSGHTMEGTFAGTEDVMMEEPTLTPLPDSNLPPDSPGAGPTQQLRDRLPARPMALFRAQARSLADRQARKELRLLPPQSERAASTVLETRSDVASQRPGQQSSSQAGQKRSADEVDTPAQSKPKKAKHASTKSKHEETPGFERRVNELEEEYVEMQRPGVYYNPPRCIYWKKGRQRACALVVIKTDLLRGLDWFATSMTDRRLYLPQGSDITLKRSQQDGKDSVAATKQFPEVDRVKKADAIVAEDTPMRELPPSDTVDRAAVHGAASQDVEEHAHPVPSVSASPFREDRQHWSSAETNAPPQASAPLSSHPEPPGERRSELHQDTRLGSGHAASWIEHAEAENPHENFYLINLERSRFPTMSRHPLTNPPQAEHGVKRKRRHPLKRDDVSRKRRQLNSGQELPAEADRPSTRYMAVRQMDDAVSTIPNAGTINSATSGTPNGALATPADKPLAAPNMDQRAPPLPTSRSQIQSDGDENSPSPVTEDKARSRSRQKDRPKVRKGTSIYAGGFTVFKREQIAIEIIQRNGGAYPDHKRAFAAAFQSEWRRVDGHTPDERTITAMVDSLKAKGSIRRLLGVYRKDGFTHQCAVLCLPHINGGSKLFREQIRRAEAAHPFAYVPDQQEVAEDLRPAKHMTMAKRVDAFVVDTGVKVRRLDLDADPSGKPKASARSGRGKSNAVTRLGADDKVELMLDKAERKAAHPVASRHERIQQQKQKVAERREKQKNNRLANIEAQRVTRRRTPKVSELFKVTTIEDLGKEYANASVEPIPRSGSPPPRQLRAWITDLDPTAWVANGGEAARSRSTGRARRTTLTDPAQMYQPSNGTFSTDFAVVKSLRPKLFVDPTIQRGFEDDMATAVQELIPEPSKGLDGSAAQHGQFYSIEDVAKWEQRHAQRFTSDMTVGVPLFINHTVDNMGLSTNQPVDSAAGVVLRDKLRPLAPHRSYAIPADRTPDAGESEPENIEEESRTAFKGNPSRSGAAPKTSVLDDENDSDFAEAGNAVADLAEPTRGKTKRRRKTAKPVKPRPQVPKPEGRLRGPNTSVLLSDEQMKNLMLSVVIVRVLFGGFDKTVDWEVVDIMLGGRYDLNVLKYRWRYMFYTNRAKIERMEADFQEAYLVAYESGAVPPLDFDRVEDYNLPSLLHWTSRHISTASLDVADDGTRLPPDRETLDACFEVQLEAGAQNDTQAFYGRMQTIMRQEAVVDELSMSTLNDALPEATPVPVLGMSSHSDFLVAKSYIRANVLAPEEGYQAAAAREILDRVPEESLSRALSTLLDAKMLKNPKKHRLQPGRNYQVHDDFRKPFRGRPALTDFMLPAHAFKHTLDAAFRHAGEWDVHMLAREGEMAALHNLLATGHVTATPLLPPITHSEKLFHPDAHGTPQRHLSIWGFAQGGFESSKVPRRLLDWPVRLRPGPAYRAGPALPAPLPPPPAPHLDPAGRLHAGVAIPLWYDIAGRFAKDRWLQLLNLTLWDAALQAGKTAAAVAAQCHRRVDAWEVRLVLEWLEGVGVVRRCGGGDGDVGWRVCGAWWLLLGAACAQLGGLDEGAE